MSTPSVLDDLSRSRPSRQFSLAAILAVLLLLPGPISATTFWVGSDPACDYATISEALFFSFLSSGSDVIKIAANQTYTSQAIVIDNQSVTLLGGYSDCEDPSASGSTTLSGTGGGSSPVVTVSNSTGSTLLVTLQDLNLNDGEEGGLRVSGPVLVQTFGVLLSNNQADLGAGVFLDGTDGGAVVLDATTRVQNNDAAFFGGGIYCVGNGTVGTRARIWSNTADVNGGGLYAASDCVVNVFRHSLSSSHLEDNDAGTDGGAIYAASGATVNVIGDDAAVLDIFSNRALFGRGGGIFATGAGTLVTLTNARVGYNSADDDGAGLAVANGARLEMQRSASCTLGLQCSEIIGNSQFATATNGSGGGIAVSSGGIALVEQTQFQLNVTFGFGRVAMVEGAGSRLEIEGAVVWNNRSTASTELFWAGNDGEISLGFTTIADNLQLPSEVAARAVDGGLVGLYSSIVAESAGQVFGVSAGTLEADCVLAHAVGTIPPAPNGTRIGPATAPSTLLVQPTGPNMHLRSDSPAIDYCDDSVWSPTTSDFDGEARGFDQPDISPVHGNFDLGADESYGDPGSIFADGFESGNTSMWSS